MSLELSPLLDGFLLRDTASALTTSDLVRLSSCSTAFRQLISRVYPWRQLCGVRLKSEQQIAAFLTFLAKANKSWLRSIDMTVNSGTFSTTMLPLSFEPLLNVTRLVVDVESFRIDDENAEQSGEHPNTKQQLGVCEAIGSGDTKVSDGTASGGDTIDNRACSTGRRRRKIENNIECKSNPAIASGGAGYVESAPSVVKQKTRDTRAVRGTKIAGNLAKRDAVATGSDVSKRDVSSKNGDVTLNPVERNDVALNGADSGDVTLNCESGDDVTDSDVLSDVASIVDWRSSDDECVRQPRSKRVRRLWRLRSRLVSSRCPAAAQSLRRCEKSGVCEKVNSARKTSTKVTPIQEMFRKLSFWMPNLANLDVRLSECGSSEALIELLTFEGIWPDLKSLKLVLSGSSKPNKSSDGCENSAKIHYRTRRFLDLESVEICEPDRNCLQLLCQTRKLTSLTLKSVPRAVRSKDSSPDGFWNDFLLTFMRASCLRELNLLGCGDKCLTSLSFLNRPAESTHFQALKVLRIGKNSMLLDHDMAQACVLQNLEILELTRVHSILGSFLETGFEKLRKLDFYKCKHVKSYDRLMMYLFRNPVFKNHSSHPKIRLVPLPDLIGDDSDPEDNSESGDSDRYLANSENQTSAWSSGELPQVLPEYGSDDSDESNDVDYGDRPRDWSNDSATDSDF